MGWDGAELGDNIGGKGRKGRNGQLEPPNNKGLYNE